MSQILVVDDSKIMREMIVACLRGQESLAFAHAASGLEVVQFIRGQDKLRDLPILIVTTRGDEASRERVLAAGASRFMTKPFAPEAILTEVLDLLQSAPA